MNRVLVTEENINKAMDILKYHLERRLKEKGYGTFASTHEIYGIMQEEVDELKEAMRYNHPDEFMGELEDVGVVALFGIACIIQKDMDW